MIGFLLNFSLEMNLKLKKIDERSEAELALEVLREEMRSQFEKYQAEMSNLHAEISRLSAKVETLEASLASRPAEVSPPPQEKIFKSKLFFRWTLLILILLQDLSERELLEKFNLLDPKLRERF